MKKILITLALVLAIAAVNAQFFQGSFTNSGNKLTFKIRPTANTNTGISYMEFAFRYNNTTTPAFAVSNIVTNTATFTGLNIQRLLPDFVAGNQTYVRFVHNTGVVNTAGTTTWVGGQEYEVFTCDLTGTSGVANIEMASNLVTQEFFFGVVDGAGVPIDPGNADQLYGPGFYREGDIHVLPLNAVPIPVRFLGFNAVKRNSDAILTWNVENESAITDRYEIERSLNGTTFAAVATVRARNNGSSTNSYEATDASIDNLRATGPMVYYRIKQIDRDGKFVYTQVRSIRLDGRTTQISVYPNPVRNNATLNLNLLEDAEVIVTINDAGGKQVQHLQLQGFRGNNIKNIDMSKFSAGSYMIKVQYGTEIKTIPVVKQ